MTDLAAAIGRVQLSRLNDICSKRRANAAAYDDLLSNVRGVVTPFVPEGVQHAYHQDSSLINGAETPNGADRDRVRTVLTEKGIGSGIYYPTPLHLNALFQNLGYSRNDFPVAQRVASQIVALPIHPLLTRNEIERVAEAVRTAVGERA